MKKTLAKETVKLGLGALLGYIGNRYIARMDSVRSLYKEDPQIASVAVSAGITLATANFANKIKDKSLQLGILGGSTARTFTEVLAIPKIASSLPHAVSATLFGESAFGEKVATVGSDELETFINMETQKRTEAMIPQLTAQIQADLERQIDGVISNATESESDETFGGDDDAFGAI
jgi:hypothetical protein